jgi:hypothetical protein
VPDRFARLVEKSFELEWNDVERRFDPLVISGRKGRKKTVLIRRRTIPWRRSIGRAELPLQDNPLAVVRRRN